VQSEKCSAQAKRLRELTTHPIPHLRRDPTCAVVLGRSLKFILRYFFLVELRPNSRISTVVPWHECCARCQSDILNQTEAYKTNLSWLGSSWVPSLFFVPKTSRNRMPAGGRNKPLHGVALGLPQSEGFGRKVAPLNPTCGMVDGRPRPKWGTGTSSIKVRLPLGKQRFSRNTPSAHFNQIHK
jgi:hypothetical protein